VSICRSHAARCVPPTRDGHDISTCEPTSISGWMFLGGRCRADSLELRICVWSPRQEWAVAAVAEGASAPATVTWASIGNAGQNSNCERDLFRWLNLKSLMQIEPYVLWLPRDLKNTEIPQLQPTPILAPHEILHCVHSFGAMQWMVSMLGADMEAGVEEFWDRSSAEPWFRENPRSVGCLCHDDVWLVCCWGPPNDRPLAHQRLAAFCNEFGHVSQLDPNHTCRVQKHLPAKRCSDRASLSRCIPLVIHADGVEIYSNTECNIWSLSSALASGHVADVKIPFLCVPEEEMGTPSLRRAMHAAVCKFVAWSLEFLFTGLFPTVGYYGEDL